MGRLAVCVAVLCGTLSCGTTSPPLSNTYGTPEALAAAVLHAIANRDRPRLEGLALDQEEFRGHVWPELPAARPERNLPFSYVWGDLRQKSELALSRTISEHGGQRYKLERVTFGDETTYPSYTVHRAASLIVRDDSDAELTLRVCGSMIEKAGAWKVFSYVID